MGEGFERVFLKLKMGNVISQTTRKLVIRVGRDLPPSSTVLRDKHRKMLEKDDMDSEDLAIKPAKISRCTSINWMYTTALQKQLNKKQHSENFPRPPVFSSRPRRDISWCPHPCLMHSSPWRKRTEAFQKLTVGQKNRLEHLQNRLSLYSKKF